MTARDEARKLGINYVYVGNVGLIDLETTKCPRCDKTLIERHGYRVTCYKLDGGKCPRCGQEIPIRGRYMPEKSLPII